ncbi:hypothetical protein ACOSP7_007181 [Xanthoceras sorbifolium]
MNIYLSKYSKISYSNQNCKLKTTKVLKRSVHQSEYRSSDYFFSEFFFFLFLFLFSFSSSFPFPYSSSFPLLLLPLLFFLFFFSFFFLYIKQSTFIFNKITKKKKEHTIKYT